VTIAEALDAEAAELDGVERRNVPAGIEWAVGAVTFAALGGDTAEFRLSEVVAAAACDTPDAGLSGRGPEWVEFRPGELNRYALDRAIAWFGSAYRTAAGATHQESKRPR
jgi:hypothetical protein